MQKAHNRVASPISDLRHSWASHMLSAGADLAYVSAQLGHANPSITLRIYSHWVPGTRRVSTSILDTKDKVHLQVNGKLSSGLFES